ncbi:MAG: peptidoglycan DD-metalloendopeptidase family protein [Bacteroidales bacterium]|nr:peptidoglycan DD-metalloendopeptidase family protein [Bacteroidales bacterium]
MKRLLIPLLLLLGGAAYGQTVKADSLVLARVDSLRAAADTLRAGDMLTFNADSLEAEEPDMQERPGDISNWLTVFARGNGAPVDTLDVGDGRFQVVLRDDNTWTLIKNIAALEESEIFQKNWNTHVVNPYNVSLESIDYRTTICLVDSVSRFVCPHQGKVFSRFGVRHGRAHTGADVPYPTGTPVYCAFDGRVRLAEKHKGYGNLIIIRHENGLETLYGHLSRIDVQVGQWVHAGDLIGLGGSTGRSSGPHLHFETRYKGFAFDPEWIVDFPGGTLRKNAFVLKRSFLSPHSKYVPESIDEEEEQYLTEEQIKAEEERIARERAAMKYHTIKSGDTLSGIASRYGTTVSKICSLNPGLKATTILSVGRKIRVK